MNKTHWNTIENTSDLSGSLLRQWIDESYQLIFDKLPKKWKEEILS